MRTSLAHAVTRDPQRIDVLKTFALNDHGWKIKIGARIDSYGSPGREFMTHDGLERDEGDAVEVSIVEVWLVGADGKIEQLLPMPMLGAEQCAEYETEIAEQVEREQGDL